MSKNIWGREVGKASHTYTAELVQRCKDNQHDLNGWEIGFVKSLGGGKKNLTPKQLEKLEAIAAKAGRGGVAIDWAYRKAERQMVVF